MSRGGKEKMEKIFFRSDAICETLRNGRLVRQGAGDSLLPRSMGGATLMFFPVRGGSTANGREVKLREPPEQRMTAGSSAGALELDESSSRH